MSTDAAESDAETPGQVSAEEVAALRERIDQLESDLAATESDDDDGKSMVIIATKGTLDMAYPPLILASTAAAFGWDVTVFHTFWGLEVLHEEHSKDLKLSAVGNPNMGVPNAVAALPGMDRVTSTMMRRRIEDNDVATIEELLDTCEAMDVEMQACQMTMDLLDYEDDEFYDGVTTGVGAATALERMADADVQLLV
jgi:peroxiredoxin family protein